MIIKHITVRNFGYVRFYDTALNSNLNIIDTHFITEIKNEYTKYEFNKDGTGCLFAEDVHYEYTSGDKVIIDFEKDIVRDCDYTYSVEKIRLP